jgi:hypothetical protein
MAIVEPVQTYDAQTEISGKVFIVSLDESPAFADAATAQLVAWEINTILERSGDQ